MAFVVFVRVCALLYAYARRSTRLWKHVRAPRVRAPSVRVRAPKRTRLFSEVAITASMSSTAPPCHLNFLSEGKM